MSEHLVGSAAILAVALRPEPGPVGNADRLTGSPDPQITALRELLDAAGGREMDTSGHETCFRFDAWQQALNAATALTSEIQKLTPSFAGAEVGVGLELAGFVDDLTVARGAAALASSAPPNEIRLGEALATLARQEPPDHRVVTRVDDHPIAEGETYRLAIARDVVPNNLPAAMTSFVGREAELRELAGVLGNARLVTMTGPPGAGKTRCAIELAERLLGRFDDGAWFVELALIADPRLMVPALAGALGLREATDRSLIDVISAYFQSRNLLVVLDNFEQITDAAIELNPLLAAAPGLHLLVTSRTMLHMSGEHQYALPPLEVPRLDMTTDEIARSEAADLFTKRAVAALPTFRLEERNAADVAALCRHLDGLPLAIELAAARVKLLSLPAILSRLDHRLALLTGGPRDVPARHQSLRAAVAWSYGLLEPSVQRLFRALSVFRGGWTIEGAVAAYADVSDQGEVLDGLAVLIDASLIVRQTIDGTEPRFTMLESLREFAGERLVEADEADGVRARHASYCLRLAELYEPQLTGSAQAAALDRLAVEHDNVRAALGLLLAAGSEDALRLGAAMWRFWQMRGHLLEGAQWLAEAFQAAGDDASADLRARALGAAGGLAYWRGDMGEAQRHYEAALAVRRAMGDPAGIANSAYDLAFVFHPIYHPSLEDPDRTAEAIRLGREAEALFAEADDEPGAAKCAWLLGTLLLFSDIPHAVIQLGASVERFRRLDDPFGLGWALYGYGDALLRSGDSSAARTALSEALELFAAAKDGSALGMLLDDFAKLAQAEGDAVRATSLRGAAASTRRVTEAEIAFATDPWLEGIARPHTLVDPGLLERAWIEGQAMSLAEATRYALGSDVVVEPDRALHVTTLGPFHVVRAGEPVAQWGGPKAGTRQAQAMFAFLLDRGERGVAKDEFIDVIWPDAEVAQADLSFHRTLSGLRGTLNLGRPSRDSAIVFANGRYRLTPSVVGWMDAAEFEALLLKAAGASDDGAAIRGLEAARSIYRADYLDDCPLYGDSGYVEERRSFLRSRLVDALVDLGRRYVAHGEPTLAAARFREALTVSGGQYPSAAEGLQRLGIAVS